MVIPEDTTTLEVTDNDLSVLSYGLTLCSRILNEEFRNSESCDSEVVAMYIKKIAQVKRLHDYLREEGVSLYERRQYSEEGSV